MENKDYQYQPVSFKKNLWKRYYTIEGVRFWLGLFIAWVSLAVFAPLISNDRPISCLYKGERYFPVISKSLQNWGVRVAQQPNGVLTQWKKLDLDSALWPLIPYDANEIDVLNANFVSPFEKQKIKSKEFSHWLGTDKLGRDVTAGLIYGARVALLVGVLSMLIAVSIGITLGMLAGWYQGRLRFLSIITAIFLSVGGVFGWFYAIIIWQYRTPIFDSILWQLLISLIIFVGVLYFFHWVGQKVTISLNIKKGIHFSIDSIILRIIEIMDSIPTLVLLIALAGIFSNSGYVSTILIIGLIGWTRIARFVRAEVLSIKERPYIDAARLLALSDLKIMWRHVLPGALPPVVITIIFGIASAIMLESTLSFLGISITDQQVSWGQQLNSARSYFSAWWMAIFPGSSIFVVVYMLYQLGQAFNQIIKPQ